MACASTVSSIPFSVFLGGLATNFAFNLILILIRSLCLGLGVALAGSTGHCLTYPAPCHGNMGNGMHYCVMLGLCAAHHILDPWEQVSAFEPLGARPVTDRDTFPYLGLGARVSQEIRAHLFHFFHFRSQKIKLNNYYIFFILILVLSLSLYLKVRIK